MSKITVPAVKFQDMVARATKGASENKLLPITSMMCIEVSNHVLTLSTTDSANTLVLRCDKVEGDDMYAVVPVKQFSGLIAKTTSDTISITLKGEELTVHGNGSHRIEQPVDEDGVVQFPHFSWHDSDEEGIINLSSVKDVLHVNKASVADYVDTPALCAYYLGDKVISTDEQTICFNDMKLMDTPHLISTEMMELLALAKTEKITWKYKDGYFFFETDDMMLYGPEQEDFESFPVDEIAGFLDVEFAAHCRLPKIALQGLIDRLALFIEPYDKNGAYLTFTTDGLRIHSKKANSDEVIPYLQSDNFTPFVCCVDIPMFKRLVDANPAESIDLWYGNESCIKMTAGKVTQVMALLEDEEMENISVG